MQKEIINIRQLTILIILVTIGDAVLILPNLIINNANQDAWISMLISIFFGLGMVYLFFSVSKLYPTLSLVQIYLKIFGKWLGLVISLFFLVYLFFSAVAHLKELGDFMTMNILPLTPTPVVNLLFTFIVIVGIRLGIEPIARTAEVFFPFICFLLVFLFILALPHIDPILIKPIMKSGVKPILLGTIPGTAFPFMELIVFLMIFQNVNQHERIKNSLFTGVLIGGIALSIIVTLCILVLGPETTKNLTFPSFILAKTIHINDILRRVEGIIALLWMVTLYFKITLYAYALHLGLAQLFNLKTYRIITLPIGMIMFATTFHIAPNLVYYKDVVAKDWPLYDVTITLLLPLLLLGVYTIRKRFNPAGAHNKEEPL